MVLHCHVGTGLDGLAGPPMVGGEVKRGTGPLGSWLELPLQMDRRLPPHFRLIRKSSPADSSHGTTASHRMPMVVTRSHREGYSKDFTDRFLQ
jgi:hypothetical protein